MNKSQEASLEVFKLCYENIFSIDKLEWWLLKYSELYNELAPEHHFLKDEGYTLYTNEFEKYPFQVCFLENYFIIDQVSILQTRESYFKNEMNLYETIKHEKAAIKSWIIKNYSLWDQEYSLFIFDNLDENFKNSDYIFRLYNQNLKLVEYRVERKAFENTIEFITFYDHLLFSNEMYKTRGWLE
jgi:hypothetical protein